MAKKIGIDLDGVLADFDAVFYPAAWKRGLLPDRMYFDQKNHTFETSFPGEISTEQVMEILLTPGFYRQMEIIPCLVKMARGFAEKGWEIHLVSARPLVGSVWQDTYDWLRDHNIPFNYLIPCLADRKHLYAEEHHLNLFVDDRLETANAVAPICTSFLVANDHNVPDEHGNPSLHPHVLRRFPEFYAQLWTIRDPERVLSLS